MAYIVQAKDFGDDAISLTLASRREALAVALEWETAGRSGVKIIGDGRIYSISDLARVVVDTE
jgi:hypothetical protein